MISHGFSYFLKKFLFLLALKVIKNIIQRVCITRSLFRWKTVFPLTTVFSMSQLITNFSCLHGGRYEPIFIVAYHRFGLGKCFLLVLCKITSRKKTRCKPDKICTTDKRRELNCLFSMRVFSVAKSNSWLFFTVGKCRKVLLEDRYSSSALLLPFV